MSITVHNPGASVVWVPDAGVRVEAGGTAIVPARTAQLNSLLATGLLTLVEESHPATRTLASPGELNRIDNVLPGKAAAEKAVVLDAHRLVDDMGMKALRLRVCNTTGATLPKGTLVCLGGFATTLNCPSVVKAAVTGSGGAATYVLPAALAHNAAGLAYRFGLVTGVDTSGAGAVGDPVYLSATAGAFEFRPPEDNAHTVQVVGVVTRKHASSGAVYFDLLGVEQLGVHMLPPASYLLPEGGIPATDLAQSVQTALSGLVLGAEGGYTLARGAANGSGTMTLLTGLTTVVAALACMTSDPSPDANAVSVVVPAQTGEDAGTIHVKVWKPTAADDNTPLPATTATDVMWLAIGTT